MVEMIWLPAALADLREIRDYIAASDPPTAARVVTEIFETPFILLDYPFAGPRIDEDRSGEVRQLHCYKYRILYRTGPALHVIGVVHGARLLPPEFLDRE